MRTINAPSMFGYTAIATAAIFLAGCSSSGSTHHTRSGDDWQHTPVHDLSQPPASADVTSAQPRVTYHYWPTAEVYFDESRRIYFWQASANQWRSGETLPQSFVLSGDERQRMALRATEPYHDHAEIEKTDPSGGVLTSIDADY